MRLAEDRCPPPSLWSETLVSSRLPEYEIWTRIHARRLARTHGEAARALLGRVALLEMIPEVLDRACQPMPAGVRTLDALHLVSMRFLASEGQQVALASYDERMRKAARKMKFRVLRLD